MFATNNVTLIEFWVGSSFPTVVNIPRQAVRELLRIDEAPTAVQYDDNSITFHYDGKRWLRTHLLSSEWPDLGRVLDTTSAQSPVPAGLFDALRTVRPFADKLGRVYFKDGRVCTHEVGDEGAAHDVEGIQGPGVYNAEMLLLLDGVATSIDFGAYPKPCLFTGERLRGAVIGMRA